MPQDRTLSISCTANCYYDANGASGAGYYGSLSYLQTASNPPMPSGTSIVSSDGTIDIAGWTNPDPSTWSDRVDITFSLAGNCTLQSGGSAAISWAPQLGGSQGAMLLFESDGTTPASSSEVEASWVSGSNNGMIEVDDKDETKDYYFRPAIIIPDAGNYYISFDPRIVNRT